MVYVLSSSTSGLSQRIGTDGCVNSRNYCITVISHRLSPICFLRPLTKEKNQVVREILNKNDPGSLKLSKVPIDLWYYHSEINVRCLYIMFIEITGYPELAFLIDVWDLHRVWTPLANAISTYEINSSVWTNCITTVCFRCSRSGIAYAPQISFSPSGLSPNLWPQTFTLSRPLTSGPDWPRCFWNLAFTQTSSK